MLKRLIRTKIGLFCLSWIVAFIVMMLMLSVRWRTPVSYTHLTLPTTD